MTVFDSNRGETSGEADVKFTALDQFVVCFRPTADGYVTLWDRMPTTAPVERLAPNVNYTGEGDEAVPVTAGETHCFGTGADGYYLQMDPNDGDGLGLMWLVFTETESGHPTAKSFSSADQFAESYRRFGAGNIATEGESADNVTGEIEPGGDCTPKTSLSFSYVVQ